MHLPGIHTPGSDAYLSHLQGFTETQHVHTLVSAYTRLKWDHMATSGNPHLRNQKFALNKRVSDSFRLEYIQLNYHQDFQSSPELITKNGVFYALCVSS